MQQIKPHLPTVLCICAFFVSWQSAVSEVPAEFIPNFSVTFEKADQGDIASRNLLTVATKDGRTIGEIELHRGIEAIDEVHYTKDRCVVIGLLSRQAGHSITIINGDTATVAASTFCFWPTISPDKAVIAFESWYPRFRPNEEIWPTVALLSIESPSPVPVQIFPPPRSHSADTGSIKKHGVVSPKAWSADGKLLAFLDKHGDFGEWRTPHEVYCVLVTIENGEAQKISRAPIRTTDFVDPAASPEYVAFSARTLEIVGGRVQGKLYPGSYWKKLSFSFSVDAILSESELRNEEIPSK
ncbi:MAG TPA: hypothetical protein PK869_03630 [Candidatus Hydrogenedentes bacterium]|nr:hypothetical protein [Candidatus Hydrogenedentota bacterium]